MGLIGEEILKKSETIEKSTHELKTGFAYLCVREKKNNSFEITVIILRNIGNVKLSYSKRILKLQNFYQNILFFFTLEAVLKMAKETNTGDVEIICARFGRHTSEKVVMNAEVNLN